MWNNLKTFYAITLGCKVNNYETNIMINDLISLGMFQVDDISKCDVAIINTCSVTNTADSKSRNMIARVRKNNPNAIIIVCGCYSQVNSNELKDKYNIDILIGNKYKNNIINLINEFLKTKNQIIKIDNLLLEKEFEDTKAEVYCNQTRAFVKIQDGCNFMCSYCIIPFTRGKQRSKNFNFLISEIKTLVDNGYKEIVLTGVNTAGYNFEDKNFFDLLNEINKINGNFRVRISSVEPFQITDEIVNLICSNPNRFSQHWHICLQSGSDNILKKMNRKYTINEFEILINKIYKLNPNSAITTDYICGFPNESNEDHENSINFIKKIKFMKLHVFPYSKRNYTPASKMKQVNPQIKKQRVSEIIALSDELTKKFINKFINKTVNVLFEKYENGVNVGHSSEYITVMVKSDKDLSNQLKKVKIQKEFLNNAIGIIE